MDALYKNRGESELRETCVGVGLFHIQVYLFCAFNDNACILNVYEMRSLASQ